MWQIEKKSREHQRERSKNVEMRHNGQKKKGGAGESEKGELKKKRSVEDEKETF